MQELICDSCNGVGEYIGLFNKEYCKNCNGTGKIKKNINEKDIKITALSQYLEINENEIEKDNYNQYCIDNKEYIVLTNEEANEFVANNIKETIWAFNAEFLICYFNCKIDVKYIKLLQQKYCEELNDFFMSLIKDMDIFIKDAILQDGRGHFIFSYDGNEEEVIIENTVYYIYRIN
jgi:hypothetical protein